MVARLPYYTCVHVGVCRFLYSLPAYMHHGRAQENCMVFTSYSLDVRHTLFSKIVLPSRLLSSCPGLGTRSSNRSRWLSAVASRNGRRRSKRPIAVMLYRGYRGCDWPDACALIGRESGRVRGGGGGGVVIDHTTA